MFLSFGFLIYLSLVTSFKLIGKENAQDTNLKEVTLEIITAPNVILAYFPSFYAT